MEIHRTHMPYGMFGKEKYPPNGVPLCDLPEEYLLWFKQRSFPKNRLGELMAHVCARRAGVAGVQPARGGLFLMLRL